MNPLRSLFLNLSKLPPALMLLLIIGLAVLVTMFVTSAEVASTSSYGQSQVQKVSASTSGPQKVALYSRTYIPLGSKIELKQIELRNTNELEVWDDAKVDTVSVVGATSKHAIPANAQIRRVDIDGQ
jgi:hypothetical protein